MRFKVVLEEIGGRGDEFLINRDYRRRFISFLKEVFYAAGREVYSSLYEKRKPPDGEKPIPLRKPFTFSVYLGDGFALPPASQWIITTPPYQFLFSTGDPFIATHFYNGVLKLKSSCNYILDLSSITKGKPFYLKIKDISLEREEFINKRAVLFKTKQPVILTHPGKGKHDEDFYLLPSDGEWEEVLSERLRKDYARVMGRELGPSPIKFYPVENPLARRHLAERGDLSRAFLEKPIKTTRIRHYGGYLRGFKGVFVLCGPVELLRFVYQFGMGVKTGQGFGYLDVILQLQGEELCQS